MDVAGGPEDGGDDGWHDGCVSTTVGCSSEVLTETEV